jgi:hypothetical protein
MAKRSPAFKRQGGNILQLIAAFQRIDQTPECLFPFPADHEIDQTGLRRCRNFFIHQRGVIAADGDFYLRKQKPDKADDFNTGLILPGHGRQTDQFRMDLKKQSFQIPRKMPAFPDQINHVNVMALVKVGADAGNSAIGQVKCTLMHNHRNRVWHGQ